MTIRYFRAREPDKSPWLYREPHNYVGYSPKYWMQLTYEEVQQHLRLGWKWYYAHHGDLFVQDKLEEQMAQEFKPMKIITGTTQRLTPLSMVYGGRTFKHLDYYWMVTNRRDAVAVKCVRLDSGLIETFKNDELVQVVNMEAQVIQGNGQ